MYQKNGYFENIVIELENLVEQKIPYDTYVRAFENMKDIAEGEPEGLNVEFENYKIGDTTISTGSHWIDFNFVLKYKQKWFAWCRGFTWVFFIIYNINQVIKLLSNRSLLDGANLNNNNQNGGGSKK